MYPQTDPRESGIGENPMSGKMQNITPEWQTERNPSVDSAVARVKGKHHDGDVLSWMACFAVKSGGTANLFVLCGWKGFSFFTKNKGGKTAPSYHLTKEKTKKCTKEYNIIIFKEEFTCTTKSPIT